MKATNRRGGVGRIVVAAFFGTDLEGEGSLQLKLTSRSGKKVAVHCHPSQGLRPQALSSLIRDLEISRDELWEWSNAGRKSR